MTPLLRLIACSLVLGSLAAADPPTAPVVITAIDANALTLTVQSSPSASDTTTYTLTNATVVQTADRAQGKLGDLVVGDHVVLTLSGSTATAVDILPQPPVAGTDNGSSPAGGGPSGGGGDGQGAPAAGASSSGPPRLHR